MRRVMTTMLAATVWIGAVGVARAQTAAVPPVMPAQQVTVPVLPASAVAQGRVAVPTPAPSSVPGTVVYPSSAAGRVVPAPSGFSVVLVLGDMQAGAGSESGLPESARKALADMKDFLPYRSYRLLDSQWTRGSGSVHSRLRGDGKDYDVSIAMSRQFTFAQTASGTPQPQPTPQQTVRFTLAEAGNSPVSATTYEYGVLKGAYQTASADALTARTQLAQLEQRLAELNAKGLGPNHPDNLAVRRDLEALRLKLAQLESVRALGLPAATAEARSNRAIIDTTFTMDIGETVVVGTSRLQGDKALIVLLTAAK